MSLDHSAAFVKCETVTRDAFLGGRLHLLQPKTGFRSGLDSVLLGASVAPQSTAVLDLGSGVGTAGLTALAWRTDRYATLVENSGEMAVLAEKNIAGNEPSARAELLQLDVTAPGRVREAAGLKRDHYASVIANPPYFDAEDGTRAADSNRAAARHMKDGDLAGWIRTAAASAAPRGEVIFVYRADGLAALLDGFADRFGAITILPIVPRPGENALRVLVRGIKGSRAPLVLKPPLVMHEAKGRGFAAEADDIFRGRDTLHW